MLAPRNGNSIPDVQIVVLHGWQKQEYEGQGRKFNINGQRLFVPNQIGDAFEYFRSVCPRFGKEFITLYKQSWWYLQGFKRKPQDQRDRDLGQTDRDGFFNFGRVISCPDGKYVWSIRFSLWLKDFNGKFGGIRFIIMHSLSKEEMINAARRNAELDRPWVEEYNRLHPFVPDHALKEKMLKELREIRDRCQQYEQSLSR